MDAVLDRILTLNLVATTAVFYVAARIYLLPRLDRLSPRLVMIPILLLHSLRHRGLMFLARDALHDVCRPDELLEKQHAMPRSLSLSRSGPRAWMIRAGSNSKWMCGHQMRTLGTK